MNNQTARYKALEYVYDLNNIANENSFKTDEHWKVSLATAAEKAAIEKNIIPLLQLK
jgi:hypothetical protein